jgi:tetratricopeptide (TPR) repeat protein
MSLLNLFRKDVAKELDRAHGWLTGGDPVRALEVARRFRDDKDPVHRTRARELAEQARHACLDRALEQAAAAEAAGNAEDAVDWIHAALQHVRDDGRRRDLENRLRALERQDDSEWDFTEAVAVERREAAEAGGGEETAEPEAAEAFDLDADSLYELLVDTLEDDVAERYADRSAEFRRAYVDLNEGRTEEALEVLHRLAEAAPSDPVLRFERGRLRLMHGDPGGARRDLEAAWAELGDAPVDRAGSLTLPALWAEATLADDDPEAVLDRLAEQADPRRGGHPDVTALYSRALISTERLQEARKLLAAAVEIHPKRQDFSHALARVLDRVGERGLAIACLETAIAPSCAGGTCSRPPLHVPSARALVALHLDAGEAGEGNVKQAGRRAGEMLQHVANAQGGRFTLPDLRLLARFQDYRGDAEAAAEVRRKVEEVEREMVKRGVSEGEEGAAVSTVDMGEMMMPGKRAVL